MPSSLFDFAVTTIFAREFLEGAIIIGEYKTIVIRCESENKNEALWAIWMSALVATVVALVVILAIAIPLLILSHAFDESTSEIIEGISKIVAGVCNLQLSLKIPKFLGLYGSCKYRNHEEKPSDPTKTTIERLDQQEEVESNNNTDLEVRVNEVIPGLSMYNMQFNVAWNIWREVAECGVFLIPSFLSGDNLEAIPVSAVIGLVVGLASGLAIYLANHRLRSKVGLTFFSALLLAFLSAGLATGGFHNLEEQWAESNDVWELDGDFWDSNRLPMTLLKPFGYSDTRTVLQVSVFWGWLFLSAILHLRKYYKAPKMENDTSDTAHSPEEAHTPNEVQADELDSLNDGEKQGGIQSIADKQTKDAGSPKIEPMDADLEDVVSENTR